MSVYYGSANIRLTKKAQALRNRLLRLGFVPMACCDLSHRDGPVWEYWHSPGGQVVWLRVELDGSAEL